MILAFYPFWHLFLEWKLSEMKFPTHEHMYDLVKWSKGEAVGYKVTIWGGA